MTRAIAFSPEQEAAIMQRYANREGAERIGKSFGVSEPVILRILRQHNIPILVGIKPKLSSKQELAIIKAYNDGASQLDLARLYGVCQPTISNALKKNDVVCRSFCGGYTYTLNEAVFSGELTLDELYWLGFIFADGHVSDSSLEFNLSSKDHNHLEKLLLFLGSNTLINTRYSLDKKRNKKHPQAQCKVHSQVLVNHLRILGVERDKSHTAIAPEECTQSSDFWRGVVDGDGCMGIYPTRRKRSPYSPSIHLCGSWSMLDQFRQWAFANVPTFISSVTPQSTIYQIGCRGSTATALIKLLYPTTGEYPALTRKLKIAQEITSRFG